MEATESCDVGLERAVIPLPEVTIDIIAAAEDDSCPPSFNTVDPILRGELNMVRPPGAELVLTILAW
jgi:hypothetical protein